MKITKLYIRQRGLKALDSIKKDLKIDANDRMSEEEIQRRFEALNLKNDPNELSEEEIELESRKTTDDGEELKDNKETEEGDDMILEPSESVDDFLSKFGEEYGLLLKAMGVKK